MKVFAIYKVYLCCFLITNPVQILVGPNKPSIPSIAYAATLNLALGSNLTIANTAIVTISNPLIVINDCAILKRN